MKAEFFFGFLSFRKNSLTLPLKLLKAETKKRETALNNKSAPKWEAMDLR